MTNHIKSVTLLHDKYPTDEHYPFNLPIFKHTRCLEFDTPVTLFVGDNGTGKSTLLEAIALGCGIHIWRKAEGTRYQVNPYEKLFFKFLSLEWSNGEVPGAYFGSDIFRDFANILDEWAASDPGQLELLDIIGKNSQTGHAQFIIATHSPILLACDGAKIYSFDHTSISEIKYEDTEHYQVYRDFLLNRTRHR